MVLFGFGFVSLKLKNRTEKINQTEKIKPNKKNLTKPIRKVQKHPKKQYGFWFLI